MTGINWLDGYAIQNYGHPFVGLTSVQQTTLLQKIEETAGAEQVFFQRAKGMTARIYYNTQIGRQELNRGDAYRPHSAATTDPTPEARCRVTI